MRMIPEKQVLAGVIMSNKKTWTEQRRFTLRALRDFGFGKEGMSLSQLIVIKLKKDNVFIIIGRYGRID